MSAQAQPIRRVPPRFAAAEPWWWPTGTTLVIDPVAGRIVRRRHIWWVFLSHADRPLAELQGIRASREGAGPWGLEAEFADGEIWIVRVVHPFAGDDEAYVLQDRARDAAGLL